MTLGHLPEPAVRLDGVGKTFAPDVIALRDVSLSVRTGEITVLLGLSGSGKSTLLRHVDGLHQPTSGSVTALGVNPATASGTELRTLRRRIGFIFQQFHLVGELSVLENVCHGALGTLRSPRLGLFGYRTSLRREALEQLDRVGMSDRPFQRADTLSGGQQQRVGVARALMQHPDVLLADEPVASLDPESSSQVMELIARISIEDDLTVLCSLHQVELALGWAHRIVGLRDGEVVLDRQTGGMGHDEAMAVYSRVGTDVVAAGLTG